MSEPKRTGRPARISRAQVVEEAMALTDEAGLDALTMRALARRLGVDPMTVYRHLRDKDDLLGAMCDRMLAGLAPLDPDAPWEPQLRAWAIELHARLAARPALLPVFTGAPVTPAAVGLTRSVVELLLRAGFSPELATAGINVVFSYVVGFAVVEASLPLAVAPEAVAGTSDADAAAAALLGEAGDFALGLDLILEGVARRVGD